MLQYCLYLERMRRLKDLPWLLEASKGKESNRVDPWTQGCYQLALCDQEADQGVPEEIEADQEALVDLEAGQEALVALEAGQEVGQEVGQEAPEDMDTDMETDTDMDMTIQFCLRSLKALQVM